MIKLPTNVYANRRWFPYMDRHLRMEIRRVENEKIYEARYH